MTSILIHTKLSLLLAAISSAFILKYSDNIAFGVADDFTATTPLASKDGIITLENGDHWYKADELENGGHYLITVRRSDGSYVMLTADDRISAEYIWHYSEDKMVTSTSPHYSELYTDTHRLFCYDGELFLTKDHWTSGEQTWNFDGSRLFHNDDGHITYLTYSEDSDVPFGCTDNASDAAHINIYTSGDEVSRCIKTHPCAESFVIEGSGYEAPTFSFELMNSAMTADSINWFVDGEMAECTDATFTADQLMNLTSGVHRVTCTVTAHDNEFHYYREQSQEALFVITKGAVPDSFITFSDVHEQYDLIGKAIEEVLVRTGGYIPSLVVCTGDLVNGPTADTDTMLKRYLPRLKPYLGGLDTVFVAGNHDSADAIAKASAESDLGADDSFSDGCGVIFRGSSDEVSSNGKNSTTAKDIIVYGINYASLNTETDTGISQNYDSIKSRIEAFLTETAENYHGELIVFSAHAGLHVLGTQPESVNLSGYTVGNWQGSNAYNIGNSYDITQLINSYAEKYGMNILFLFGHDHSQSEKEFILEKGDTIVCPTDSASKLKQELPLDFTYAHAGYLSTVIGIADAHFSFIRKSGDKLTYELLSANDPSFIKSTEIDLYPSNPTALSDTSEKATLSEKKSADNKTNKSISPVTSAKMNITPFIVVSVIMMIISRKRKKHSDK